MGRQTFGAAVGNMIHSVKETMNLFKVTSCLR